MGPLDLRSLVVMCSIMGALLALVMFFLRLSYPRGIRGPGLWAAAPAWICLSALLFACRGVLSDAVSVVLANLVLLVGVAAYHAGLERFFGREPAWGRWALLLAVLTPPMYWFTLVTPDYNVRLLMICPVWAAIFLSMVWTIWRDGPRTFSSYFTIVALGVHAGVLLLRSSAAGFLPDEEGLLTPTRIQTVYIASNAMMLLSLGMGLILMVGDRLRAEFEHVASHDPLTQVLTRRVFLDACAQELARCRRHGHRMALLLLDIDHFKTVNDTHGHQMGDRVLVDFCRRVATLLRQPDLLARYGGEEFVLLLPETSPEEAVKVAERILARVAEPVDGLPSITVSIGVASNRPDEADIDGLLARADRALYRAKDGGRNCVEQA